MSGFQVGSALSEALPDPTMADKLDVEFSKRDNSSWSDTISRPRMCLMHNVTIPVPQERELIDRALTCGSRSWRGKVLL